MLVGAKKSAKRLAFTVENLAKSSRDESEIKSDTEEVQSVECNGSTRTQNISFSCVSPHNFNWMSPPEIPDRLSPESDPGYKSLQQTPTHSGQKKRKRFSSEETETESFDVSLLSRDRLTSATSSETSFESLSPPASDSDDSENRRKKIRTAFSSEQVCALEERYLSQRYLPAGERTSIAKKLKLTDQQVKTWFQNRRMKEKRQQKDDEHSRNFYLPTGGVDISQLHALGLPCPPPYMFNSTHVTAPANHSHSANHSPYSAYSHQQIQQRVAIPGMLTDNRFQMQSFPMGYSPLMPPMQFFPRTSPSVNQIQGTFSRVSPLTNQMMSPMSRTSPTANEVLASPTLTSPH